MLLGRDRERQELERLLAVARSGAAAVLGIVGDPGVGKTALLDYAQEKAGTLRVLRARGIESESQVAFAGLSELLRPALGLIDRIPGPQAEALTVALALRTGAVADRFAIGAGTLSLLAAFAEQTPALLVLDDAHLIDAPSSQALRFALRRLLAEPVCALVAAREGEESLLDGSGLATMRLRGLDHAAARALLGELDGGTADRLHEATGGNPLALLALREPTDALLAQPLAGPLELPEAVSKAFLRRAESLDPAARRLAVLLAVASGAELRTVERAAEHAGIDMSSLAAVQDCGLVGVRAGRIEFVHPLAGAAVYSSAPLAERNAAHRSLAAVLPDRDAEARAWHLSAAAVGTDTTAAAALEQAARIARDRGGYGAATAAFARAATLTPDDAKRASLLLEGAEAAWSAGLGDRALSLIGQIGGLAATEGTVLRADHLAGRIAARQGPVMRGHEILLRAADRAAPAEPELAVSILAEAVDACFYAGDARQMERTARRIDDLVGAGSSERSRFLAELSAGMAQIFAGAGTAGVQAIRRGVAIAERDELLVQAPQLQPWLVMGPLWLRELEAGETLIEIAIENARERVSLDVLPWLLDRIARLHAGTDAWRAAAIEYDEAISLARESGQRVELASALAGLAWLQARTGEADACRAGAAEAQALCRQLGVGLYETWAIRSLGELELTLGHSDAAIEHFEQLAQRLVDLGIADPDLSPAPELVDLYLRVGRREDALEVLLAYRKAVDRKGQPWAAGRAARCEGLLAGDDFAHHFETALGLHERTPDRYETALTRLAYGGRLRRARQRRMAREQLNEALDILQELGARLWSQLVRDELAATGERARRRDPSTLDDLTPQELHIAQLLAGGMTIREAAAAVFLSPKTIEYHLRNTYRKLGVNSRDKLAAALASQPGDEQ